MSGIDSGAPALLYLADFLVYGWLCYCHGVLEAHRAPDSAPVRRAFELARFFGQRG